MNNDFTISQYLVSRLREIGIKHVFGVPGDYVLDFCDAIIASPVRWVGTCNELNAGYAADGYARLNGAGCAVVTYGVGGLSILNAVAGAYAEQVPMVVISGAPGSRRREAGAMVHHLISNYYLQLDVYKKLTTDATIITDPETAPDEIDRVLRNCVARKLPVYIELPADMAVARCRKPGEMRFEKQPPSHGESLRECLAEVAGLLNSAKNPIIMAGVELQRFALGRDTLRLVETSEVPFTTMLSSKSILPEYHPQFAGIYQGGWSRESVRKQVEESDCLLSLGVWITDLDTGMFSINLDNRRMISVGGGKASIGNHFYQDIQLGDFIRELTKAVKPREYAGSHPAQMFEPRKAFVPVKTAILTAPRLYECINWYLDDSMVLLSEPGDAFCAAPEFQIEEADNFIVQSYYCSIGYCTPAALGVSLARPEKRPFILSGDGAFQMTAAEVSTLIRERRPGVLLIINNDGYLIERVLHEDGPYNDIQMWNYSWMGDLFDGRDFVKGFKVKTEEELDQAMQCVTNETNKLVIIEACLPNRDYSAGLQRLGEAFRGKK
jgi:TPP-dependent 2-oxoacid decarboxylase